MRPIEDIAREATEDTGWCYAVQRQWLERFAAIVRAEALEEAAKVCDVTPPYPFRHSIEAAHAIRRLKGATAAQPATPHL